MSVVIGDEEFTEFSNLYNDPDFMTIEEREKVEKKLRKSEKS